MSKKAAESFQSGYDSVASPANDLLDLTQEDIDRQDASLPPIEEPIEEPIDLEPKPRKYNAHEKKALMRKAQTHQ